MNSRQQKFVRFQDQSSGAGSFPMKFRPSLNPVMDALTRGFEKGSETLRSLKKPISFGSSSNKPTKEKELGSRNRILNPQGQFLQTWNKMFLFSCAIALAVDPLFFYIPVIDGQRSCLNLDHRLEITACILRTFIDAFYIVHMMFQFRTAFIAPPSRVFGRGVLIEDARVIAKRYLSKFFIIDILAILPLPQVVILIITPTIEGPVSLVTKDLLKFIILCQYVPRIIRIFPLYKEVTRTSGVLTETAWAGAALNLFLYMLASHVLGAFWYLFSIEREDMCWRKAIGSGEHSALYCDKTSTAVNATLVSLLNTSCPFTKPDPKVFNFGIFNDALASGVAESRDFPKKFFYCFWWGLRNLSSLGQNLKTSTFVAEIIFAISIPILGLVLFAQLIGNMKKYLQSTGIRIEEMREKRQDEEQWMSHRMLPENLRERIRRYEHYKWQETEGVEEEMLISNLPKDLRRKIKRHLCLDLLKRVPMFEKMDEQLLDAMCDRLEPALYTDKSYIVREGDPVEKMLFIIRGNLISTTTNGGRTGFFNAVYLKAGDFCGDDLLTWALDPLSSSNLPLSTRTVQALKEVEAFALMADDLKFVASQFRRLHSKQFQHTFKFYSVQWQTWAAFFIQAAWRRCCRRKLVKSLREAEDKLQDALAKESGATLYASKFAANGSQSARLTRRLPSLLPQKPAEPDFTAER
ncbi:cyclic nucleotide-gated ion channel 1-like [Durio zibethinus]|uniref:Cyclic nucleotide-gated ion channel 1-like n=1 Tax=Durio zibethinus TaxID=66656 RepID=A0A6P5Y0J3_DURZI|nr:cyclic nucleotide-gated ion channel 1-like [Durio zibethinus]